MKDGFKRVDGEMKGLRAQLTNQGKELRGEMAAVEARLRALASEHHVRTREEIAKVHNDNRQVHAEMQAFHGQMHALQRTMIQIAAGTAGTVLLTVLGVMITRL
jgi:hypothetical protein